MGANFSSGCHRCEEAVLHYRGKENETMMPFYKRHDICGKLDTSNVVTVFSYFEEPEWTDKYKAVMDKHEGWDSKYGGSILSLSTAEDIQDAMRGRGIL